MCFDTPTCRATGPRSSMLRCACSSTSPFPFPSSEIIFRLVRKAGSNSVWGAEAQTANVTLVDSGSAVTLVCIRVGHRYTRGIPPIFGKCVYFRDVDHKRMGGYPTTHGHTVQFGPLPPYENDHQNCLLYSDCQSFSFGCQLHGEIRWQWRLQHNSSLRQRDVRRRHLHGLRGHV